MTPTTGSVEFVLDVIDHTALRPEDLPVLPSQLPCGLCGVPEGHHCSPRTSCRTFRRPRLPEGYAFVDELAVGDRFRFFSRRLDQCERTLLSPPGRLREHLLQVSSTADRCQPATHWLHDLTLVVVAGPARPS